MLQKIKTALRITHNALDSEIQDVIDAALMSLNYHGVQTEGHADDPLILNAVRLYARWQFNYLDKAAQFEKAWKAAVVVLSLCGEYGENDE